MSDNNAHVAKLIDCHGFFVSASGSFYSHLEDNTDSKLPLVT